MKAATKFDFGGADLDLDTIPERASEVTRETAVEEPDTQGQEG